jgi:hypothetical protein
LIWKTGLAEVKPPDQPGCEKAVVKPLVGGKHFRCAGEFRRQLERLVAARRVPQHHLQIDDVEVDQRHQPDKHIGDHALFPHRGMAPPRDIDHARRRSRNTYCSVQPGNQCALSSTAFRLANISALVSFPGV